MANINITLEAGLTNDYGVFNLDYNKRQCLSVDIISDGDQFVESENSEFQHGGNTNYRNHEGIKPIDSDTHNWENYGLTLVNKLKNYINSLIKNTYQSDVVISEYYSKDKTLNEQIEEYDEKIKTTIEETEIKKLVLEVLTLYKDKNTTLIQIKS